MFRKDVYVDNESTGFVLTCQGAAGRKPKKSTATNWERLSVADSLVALSLHQDASFVVRVVVEGELTDVENAEWVDRHTAKLVLPKNGLAVCGGRDYVDDPTDEDNDAVAFLDVPAGAYAIELFTYFTSPNDPWSKRSPWPEPPALGDRRYVDFLLRLTPWTDGFVCTPTDEAGWIPWRKPPRTPETAPRGIIAESPEGWTPEDTRQPGELDGESIPPPGREHIRILTIPPGDAPEWVRQAWVELELPLVPQHAGPVDTSFVDEFAARLAKANPKAGDWMRKLTAAAPQPAPEPPRDQVYIGEAVAVLAKSNPQAAQWWRDNFRKAIEGGHKFEFAPEVYERVGS